MKFALIALLGAAQARTTLFTTTGQVAFVEEEETNVQLNASGPSMMERFSSDDDDIFMRSMLNNFAKEGEADGAPNGKFSINKSSMNAAASEVLCTHKGLCGEKLAGYLSTYFAKAWSHFDVNQTGAVEALKAPQFMRFLASDQYMSLQ